MSRWQIILKKISGLTLKSWNSQGVTSLDVMGDLGLELPGDSGRPSA